jgi:hypothetical protein
MVNNTNFLVANRGEIRKYYPIPIVLPYFCPSKVSLTSMFLAIDSRWPASFARVVHCVAVEHRRAYGGVFFRLLPFVFSGLGGQNSSQLILVSVRRPATGIAYRGWTSTVPGGGGNPQTLPGLAALGLRLIVLLGLA